jgi:hypothetical protein
MANNAEVDLVKLVADAQRVGQEHQKLTDAISEEHKAEAALLAKVVEAVRPALKALSSRLKVYERTWWPDGVSTDTQTRIRINPGSSGEIVRTNFWDNMQLGRSSIFKSVVEVWTKSGWVVLFELSQDRDFTHTLLRIKAAKVLQLRDT